MKFALTYHVRIRLLSIGVLAALSLARAQSRGIRGIPAPGAQWLPRRTHSSSCQEAEDGASYDTMSDVSDTAQRAVFQDKGSRRGQTRMPPAES